MKNLIYIFLALTLISCNNKFNYGFVYYMHSSNDYDSVLNLKYFNTPTKFVSYKNYLFESVASLATINKINGNENSSQQTTNYTIYVIEAKNNQVVEIDSLNINFKLLQKLTFENKSGITNKDSNKSYEEHIQALNSKTKRDTIINKTKYIVVDTSFIFADTMHLKNFLFFTSYPKINTIFNINYTGKLVLRNQLVSIMSMHFDKTIFQYTIKDLKELTKEEAEICEKIISQLKKDKHL